MAKNKGKIYLIPNLLGDSADLENSIPLGNKLLIASLYHFAVEHLREARRFLVKMGLKSKIDESRFIEINKHSPDEVNGQLINYLEEGHSVGIISDAGCPAIADPGSTFCYMAHQRSIEIIPLVGPSSIFLALMASGFDGQSFAFRGYLNRDKLQRKKEIKKLEERAIKEKQTQIFMETPYRNEALWQDLIADLNSSTKLCVAANISLPNQFIRSMSVDLWKKTKQPHLNKVPAIFLLSA